ncbi:MFS transporter [Acidisoma cellulosilytica]|uniref:MFS transporter n=1 Tax=Acidisoma cellulosilyticum TaxID=2802395 RepID=A0A963Z2W5_9PROT|nr:MFS transporter [Acidisoma cellulosilyticum]
MLALISIAVVINYLDRAIIGIAAPAFKLEFGLSSALLGVVFSAFSWTYFLSQVPSGILLDRFGPRMIYSLSLTFWSIITLLQAFVGGVGSLIGLRLGLGIAEAPCFPANSNVVGMWFPRSERARAISVYTAAEYVGLGFLSPVLFWIMAHFGWRSLFGISGAIGLAYAFVFWSRYSDPSTSKSVNGAELDLIEQGDGITTKLEPVKFEWRHIRALFRHRQVWGLCIGQFSVYSTITFFLTWFPTYLVTARHMAWIKVGFFSTLPYIAGFFGVLVAGWWSDRMIKSGISLNLSRKAPVVVGLLVSAIIIAANYVNNDQAVIAILSVTFFAAAMANAGWAVVSEVAPRGFLGLLGGLYSAAANLAGIVTPLVIGIIVQKTGSFVGALVFVGVVAALGALSWIFVIGDIRRVEIS